MLEIQQQIISYNKTSRSSQPIYIVIHDTGSPSSTAQNNHDYFAGGNRGASADFFVDSDNIIQIIDTDSNYSWAVGDGKGVYGITNANSVSIEMCIGSDSTPTETTISNTVNLTRYLMSKYGIGIDNVVRHYDCSHKICPNCFSDNSWSAWYEFKEKVTNGSSNKLGWNQNATGWFYCTDIDNGYYYKGEWKQIEGEWYSFDSDGYARCSKWILDNSNYYYLDENCAMVSYKWVQYNNQWYYLKSDGKMAIGWVQDSSNKWHYCDENGVMQTGWIELDKKWYYLGTDGAMYEKGTYTIDNKSYDFDSSGVMIDNTVTTPSTLTASSTTSVVSTDLFNFVKFFEGCYLTSYLCPSNVLTIGIGCTNTKWTSLGTIAESQAIEAFNEDMKTFADGVDKLVSSAGISLNTTQRESLISFSFNVGLGALASSTLWSNICKGVTNAETIIENFGRWVKSSDGSTLAGLVKRRKYEANLYLTGSYSTGE